MLMAQRRLPARDFVWVVAFAVACVMAMTYTTAYSEENLSDETIDTAVENEIIFDGVVPFNDMDVATIDGIVTLTGSVTNILDRDRALEIAETVRGVRGVVNRIIVRPHKKRTGKELVSNVRSALRLDAATDSYEVTVDANSNGEVTLRGTVDSWDEKHLSEQVAKGVAGVTDVNNEIDINFHGTRPDSEIKPEVQKRLDWDVLVDDALIDVEVKNGIVKLSGSVGSAVEVRRARYDAWVGGAKAVDVSNIEVKGWIRDKHVRDKRYVTREDSDIAAAVKDALMYDPRVLSFKITPKVDTGMVTLRGTVDNAEARRAAGQDARNIVGVVDVRNRIKVRSRLELSDKTIADNLRIAFMLDPWIQRYEITVSVTARIAHLYGTVDTPFEKMHAQKIAYRSAGVVEVRNHLDVEFEENFTQSPYIYPYFWQAYPERIAAGCETGNRF